MRGSLALLGALALGGLGEASGTRLLRQYSWLVSGASASAPAAAASSPMAAATGPSATPSSDTVKTVESGSANDGMMMGTGNYAQYAATAVASGPVAAATWSAPMPPKGVWVPQADDGAGAFVLASETPPTPPGGMWTPLRIFGDRPPAPPTVTEGPVVGVSAAATANSNLWAVSLQNLADDAQNGTPTLVSAPVAAPGPKQAPAAAPAVAPAPAPEPPASDM